MTHEVPLSDKISISLTAIFWLVLICAAVLCVPVLYSASPLLFLTAVGVVLLLAVPIYLVRRWLRHRSGDPAPFSLYLRTAVASALIVISLVALPVYYLAVKTATDPVTLPLATLTDGKKTVVFQGMLHVGSEPFYKAVVYDLEKALVDGYRLYYEGVQPSPGEGEEWFKKYLAQGGDLSANYQKLARGCGLDFQLDYFQLLTADMKREPGRHLTADVNYLDMKREFDRLKRTDPEFARKVAALEKRTPGGGDDSGAFLAAFLDWMAKATPGQQAIGGILCRGFFSMALGGGSDKDKKDANPMDRVVLDFRNKRLVETIVADPADKIYITYGAAHLPGVIALLKQQNPAWKVVSVKWVRGMATPEHLEGKL